MINNDCFGINRIYQENAFKKYFPNLIAHLSDVGFSDYSKEGITSFFSFRYPILEDTMFQGISKYDFSSITGTPIDAWKPRFLHQKMTITQAVSKTEELLIVEIAKLVDGKKRIGITLSGGIDSSLIVSILKKHFQDKELFTYSIGFYGDNEFEYSRQVSDLFSNKHWESVLTKKEFIGENSILRDLIALKGAPLHPNELPLAIAEKQAYKDGCDIVLCGEGADDIFGGYGQNLRMYMNPESKNDYSSFLMNNYRYFNLSELEHLIKKKYIVDDVSLVTEIFDEESCPESIKDKMFYFIQRIHTRGLIERGVNALRYNDFKPGFPFIGRDLVEFANKIPFDYKVRWKDGFSDDNVNESDYRNISEKYDITKYTLKKVAEKYLPLNIVYRQKYGFPVPFEFWFSNLDTYDLDSEVFNTNDISQLNGWKKFMVLNLNTFIQHFNKYKQNI